MAGQCRAYYVAPNPLWRFSIGSSFDRISTSTRVVGVANTKQMSLVAHAGDCTYFTCRHSPRRGSLRSDGAVRLLIAHNCRRAAHEDVKSVDGFPCRVGFSRLGRLIGNQSDSRTPSSMLTDRSFRCSDRVRNEMFFRCNFCRQLSQAGKKVHSSTDHFPVAGRTL